VNVTQAIRVTTRSEINRGTPKVTVFSNQGLAVRQLSYYRREAGVAAQVRINLQRYNSAGQLKSSIDPRLSDAYLKDPSAMIPNQQQQNTLSGKVLKSDNVDAGTRVVFPDVQGKPLWSWDSRGTESSFDYDKLRRVTAVHEKERGKESHCRERFHYGEVPDTTAKNNTVGQLIKHYDTAGLQLIPIYNLLGVATQDDRTFLNAETIVNWTEDEQENVKLLEEESYSSRSESNALGQTLSQIDAANNLRSTDYTVSGQVHQTTLQLNEGATQILTHNRHYRATGQLQSEALGNSVQIQYDYEPDTQRLKEKRATRLSDNKLLQSLQYTYDPVGNILSIEDKAQETEYYKNAKAESISHYAYDSFYQLISADGIESEQASCETSRLPHAISFGNKDTSRLVNYQRTYDYDAGGNLYAIHHQGAGIPCMRELTIDTLSNRGIEKRDSGPNLQKSFDANGNLLYLNIDQPLTWDNRNQLQETIQVERIDTPSDKESYLYDGQGMRLQKTRLYLSENQIHTERVRYLSGLELREHWQTDLQGQNKQIREELYLIQAQAGTVPVKVLHWETEPPNAIENDAIYYSLSDQLGSNQIELNKTAEITSFESYYPYGGTAIWSTKNQIESSYKYYRYSGKERDHSGLYYYGYRYYMSWLGRWLNPDPSGIAGGFNLFCMARNNPVTFLDNDGKVPTHLRDLLPTRVLGSTIERGVEKPRYYREMTHIPQRGIVPAMDVNARIWEEGVESLGAGGEAVLGNQFYWITGLKQGETLVVNAHSAFSYPLAKPTVLGKDSPVITVLNPHWSKLRNLPFAIGKTYADISFSGVTATSQEALKKLKNAPAYLTGTETIGAFGKYNLKKRETHTAGAPHAHRFELFAMRTKSSDFLAVRGKAGEVTSEDVINFAIRKGYKRLVFNACRGACSVGNFAEIFDPAVNITPLDSPVFISWSDLSTPAAGISVSFQGPHERLISSTNTSAYASIASGISISLPGPHASLPSYERFTMEEVD
jgi:insecticidal toxin complex protein TccC